MKFTIITPTYRDHFHYIKRYLKSFNKYTTDKDKYNIVFTISRSEKEEFFEIINNYKRDLNIDILFFEDLLTYYNVKLPPDEIIKKYGRFTFQTLKKFYTMMYVDSEYFLVLDSESMVIRKTSISSLFEGFFKSPYIIGSNIDISRRHEIVNIIESNINFLLKTKCNIWFLEHFVWFYEKKILLNLIRESGEPIFMAEQIYKKNFELRVEKDIKFGIFEILLYQNYLFKNHKKLKYTYINLDNMLISKMGEKKYENYKNAFYERFKGHCGLIEQICLILSKSNYKIIGKILSQFHINIIRCEFTDVKNYKLQKKFLKIVHPNILAASQNHLWGLNNNFKNKYNLFMRDSKNYKKLKKHIKNFLFPFQVIETTIKKILIVFISKFKKYVIRPFYYFGKWIMEPFSILFYLFKLIIRFIKIF